MNHRKTRLILMCLLLLLAACGSAASDQSIASEPAPPMEAPAMEEEAMEEAEFAAVADSDTGGRAGVTVAQNAQSQPLSQERLIIRTAEMSIVVENTEEAMATITNMVEENGGWVVSSSLFQYDENAKTGNIIVRVPAEGFNSALEAIRAMAVEVTRETSSGQDVTEEYVDLQSRLENLEATAARVRNFLDEAKDVEEALAVNSELSRLEGEIEVIKGRIQYLSQSAAFSTINIELTPDIISQPLEVGWRPLAIARDAVEDLVDALQGIAGFLIRLGILFLPLALLFGIPVWLVVRYVVNRRRNRRPQVKTPPTETE